MRGSGITESRRVGIPLSGDTPWTPAWMRLLRFFHRPLRRRESVGGYVLIAAALACVPLGLATIAFGHAFRASETSRADARLSAATSIALDQIEHAGSAAAVAAQALAGSRQLQRALVRHDLAAAERLGYRRGPLAVVVVPAAVPRSAAPGTVVRSSFISLARARVGRVDAIVRLSPLLAAASTTTHTNLALTNDDRVAEGPLQGWLPQVGHGEPTMVAFHGQQYRTLTTKLQSGGLLVAEVSEHSIATSVRHRQFLVFGAGALTLAALALVAFVVLDGGVVRGRRRRRDPVSLVADVAAAAHDPRALLPVLLETAVVAVDAAGGRVIWDGEEVAVIGEHTRSSGTIALALDDQPDKNRRIVLYPTRAGFSRGDRETLDSLLAQGRIALENSHLHSIVQRQAITDELTDLANRRQFMTVLRHEVARAIRFESPLALILFDLDRFKQINDRFGHQAGDDVLRSVADALRGRLRDADLAARIGGEEFAIILTGTGEPGALTLAEQLRHDLSHTVRVFGGKWTVTASFGVAVFRHGETAELLIAASDRALYRAKADGRNLVRAATSETSSFRN